MFPIHAKQETSHSSDDTIKLLNIFSTEIWFMILKHFQMEATFQEQEDASNSSELFREILSGDRVHFLFPKVADILKCRGYETELLQCRVACRSWNDAVSELYQRSKPHFSFERKTNNSDEYATVKFKKIAQVQMFMEHFGTTHYDPILETSTNPFLGRSVSLQGHKEHRRSYNVRHELVATLEANQILEGIEEIHGWSRNVVEEANYFLLCDLFCNLLVTFGHHILYLNVELPSFSHDINSTVCKCYSNLREILLLTKNVKVLTVAFEGNLSSLPSRFLPSAPEVISANPLQEVENLTCLKSDNLPTPIFNELVRANNHITRLEITKFYDYGIFSSKSLLPNLKAILITITRLEELNYFDDAFSTKWNLKTLSFVVDIPEESGFIEWDKIFSLIESKWGQTVQFVRLVLPKGETTNDENNILEHSSKYRWNLPYVKRLKLHIKNVASIDFLLPLANSLEFLHIVLSGDIMTNYKDDLQHCKAQSKQIVEFLGFIKEMKSSNIWRLFPKLMKVSITYSNNKTVCFWRKGYFNGTNVPPSNV